METHQLHTAEVHVGQDNHVTIRLVQSEKSSLESPEVVEVLSGTLGFAPGIHSSLPKNAPETQKTDNSLTFRSVRLFGVFVS